jgi:hypothetical protein
MTDQTATSSEICRPRTLREKDLPSTTCRRIHSLPCAEKLLTDGIASRARPTYGLTRRNSATQHFENQCLHHIKQPQQSAGFSCIVWLCVARLRSPDWTDSEVSYQRCNAVLPLLGRGGGLDRCYGSFDCVVYGLTNSGVLKRGSSEACDEAKMEVNEPIRMRVRVRNWWPPWW